MSLKLHIVLFEPEIPQNTGNIARTCACIGATLHLVEPLGFRPSERNLKRAGLDYWDDVKIVHHASTKAFLDEHSADNLYFFTGQAECSYAEVDYAGEVFLVFGARKPRHRSRDPGAFCCAVRAHSYERGPAFAQSVERSGDRRL